MREGNALLH